jgi:Rieske Fe-S protein
VTAGIAGVIGVPVGAALIAPALRKEDAAWSPVGRIGDPEAGEPDLAVEGKPMLTTFTALVQDAYMSAAPQNVPVFVVNRGNNEFTVFDVRCTHLGCPVTWKEEDQEFFSPCHGGVFDIDGRVVAGPPPRPLDRYDYKIEGDVLFAGKLYQVDANLDRV